MSIQGLKLDEPRDKVFSVLAIIQILMMENPPDSLGYTVSKGLRIVDKYPEAAPDFDIDTWFILSEAYLAAGDRNKAEESFYGINLSSSISKDHKIWASELWNLSPFGSCYYMSLKVIRIQCSRPLKRLLIDALGDTTP